MKFKIISILIALFTLSAINGCERESIDKPNNSPSPIEVIVSTTTTQGGGTIDITALATDPDGDALTYTWIAEGGVLNIITDNSVTWNAPFVGENKVFTIRVKATDGRGGRSDNSVEITVAPSTPPDFFDDFSDAEGWEAKRGIWTTEDGSYCVVGDQSGYLNVSLISEIKSNFILEAKVKWKGGSLNNAFGLCFRGNSGNCYNFGINSFGSFILGKTLEGPWINIENWNTYSRRFCLIGDWNTLRVSCLDTEMKLYLNGQILGTYNDDSLSEGYFGIFSNSKVDTCFDEISLTSINDK